MNLEIKTKRAFQNGAGKYEQNSFLYDTEKRIMAILLQELQRVIKVSEGTYGQEIILKRNNSNDYDGKCEELIDKHRKIKTATRAKGAIKRQKYLSKRMEKSQVRKEAVQIFRQITTM